MSRMKNLFSHNQITRAQLVKILSVARISFLALCYFSKATRRLQQQKTDAKENAVSRTGSVFSYEKNKKKPEKKFFLGTIRCWSVYTYSCVQRIFAEHVAFATRENFPPRPLLALHVHFSPPRNYSPSLFSPFAQKRESLLSILFVILYSLSFIFPFQADASVPKWHNIIRLKLVPYRLIFHWREESCVALLFLPMSFLLYLSSRSFSNSAFLSLSARCVLRTRKGLDRRHLCVCTPFPGLS